ncbi:tRNA-guanine(15) transglycosylase [uncultured archaeon]|nr:tRNA-guanine(15) transglycosylase [uncultured archaeon]
MNPFKIKSQCGRARQGILNTAHGRLKTPMFMPVATKGSVKHLSMEEVESTGTQCLISNAFVLSMKPGVEVIAKAGGLHRFMNWEHGVFTDSGGFQVLSPDFCLGLKDEGVQFRNPFTGKKMLFSPEYSVEIQAALGSDVAMCLDDVPTAGVPPARLKEAVERTTAWAKRCLEAHLASGKGGKQLLFGICQGGVDKELREKSAREISGLEAGGRGFDGYAIGGLVIGEPKEKTFPAVDAALPFLPEEKPRYMMGVGSPGELVAAIGRGVDIFDSCFATRTARHGRAFTSKGNINIDSAKFKMDFGPVDENCECFVCKNHSRAYLHHLFRTGEENAGEYLTYHNIWFLQKLMEKIRAEIKEGSFLAKQ